MKLDSVNELKRSFLLRAAVVKERTVRSRAARLTVPLGQSVAVAYGAAPMGKKGQYRLAVRVLGGRLWDVEPLVPDLSRVPDAELDLVEGVKFEKRLTLQAGGSSGHYRITAGTLGAFVEDDDNYYMLSNNHVFANSDKANIGDEIWQPGRVDIVGGRYNVIGFLERRLTLDGTRRDNLDAAIASFSDQVTSFYPWDYQGIGRIKPQPISDRYSVSRVAKRGRSTRVTRGVVTAFDLDGVQINFGSRRSPRWVAFDNQIEIIDVKSAVRDFSAPGDSGSLIIDSDTMQPYALLYGGGPDRQGIDRTLAHFLPDVLNRLKVRLVQ